MVVGILLSSAVGLPTANVPLWRLNYAIVAVPAVFQFFTMTTCVESPRWLISVGKIEESLCCLQKLRGSTADVTGEFFDIVAGQLGKKKAIALLKDKSSSEKKVSANVDEGFDDGSFSNGKSESSDLEENNDDEQRAPMNFIEIFKDPVIRKITLIVLFHHTIQQLSGMNAVMYYSTTIFESSVSHETAQLYAIYTTLVNFGMSLVAMAMVDRQGRRVLLLLSEMGTFIFSILLVIGYHYNIGNLLIASVFLYVASFAIGIGPIPWMITSEMTPIYASSSVGAAATAMNWAMNFFIGQVFPVIFAAIQGWSFLIFAIICLISAITTFFFLPETKGRSIESIVHGFHK